MNMDDPVEQPQAQPAQPPQPVQSGDSNGMALASMIIGLCAALLALIPIIGFISWLLAPLAIVFGLIGMNSDNGRGFALTGIISGGVGLLICVFWLMAWWGLINLGQEVTEDFENRVRAEQALRDAKSTSQ
jgi:hypothetical protein